MFRSIFVFIYKLTLSCYLQVTIIWHKFEDHCTENTEFIIADIAVVFCFLFVSHLDNNLFTNLAVPFLFLGSILAFPHVHTFNPSPRGFRYWVRCPMSGGLCLIAKEIKQRCYNHIVYKDGSQY